MSTRRMHKISVQSESSLGVKLGELRWLLSQLSDAADDLTVSVSKYEGDQRESGYVTLSIEISNVPVKTKVMR